MLVNESAHLNDTDQKVLKAIRAFQSQNNYAPTIREIGTMVGIESTSHVSYCLRKLQTQGLIQCGKGRSRAIQLIGPAPTSSLRTDSTLRIPVFGRIQAGYPIPIPDTDFSIFDSETFIEVPFSHLPKNSTDLFALQVQGDSMIDAMIADKDIVVFRATNQARNGEMVAAYLKSNSETTLKKYYLEGDQVRLQPANPSFKPIYAAPGDVDIQGQVVFVFRDYNLL